MSKIKVAIIGYGGIARLHYAAYKSLIDSGFPIEVVAICEKNKESVFKNVSINLGGNVVALDENIHIFGDADELIENESFDMADICLPTFLHKAMSVKLLQAGKHVLCEKPMALTSDECHEMVEASRSSGKHLMIGQCLRFSSVYIYLKQCIDDKRFGELKYLDLYRLCDYPKWASDFASLEKTGGCILDTHIHDIDVARYLLGEPDAVSCIEYKDVPRCQMADTRLFYDTVTVDAKVAWDETRLIPFVSGYQARFDNADVICEGSSVIIDYKGGDRVSAEVEDCDMIREEIKGFAEAIMRGENCPDNSPESSMMSVKLIECIKDSASKRGDKIINKF